jgi:hypothetical protein
MADYTIADDGKLHTRYSELMRCTPGQIDRVIAERNNPGFRTETEHMGFGTLRHEMFEAEARRTGRLPACFHRDAPADYIEHEFTTEIWPGVIVHSRPDVASEQLQTVFDYKTVVDGKSGWRKIVDGYRYQSKQRQLVFYAYQMGLHGIKITNGAFLCEVWNEARDTILRYEVVQFPIMLRDMGAAVLWAKGRVALLQAVLEEVPA